MLRQFQVPALLFCVAPVWLGALGLMHAGSVYGQQPVAASQSQFAWKQDDAGVSLTRGQQLVLRYEFASGTKPIVYPIIGPHGKSIMRDFPMKSAPAGGTKDHVHHRSLWLTHGEVNGIDFWLEDAKKAGRILHGEVVDAHANAAEARLTTTAKWVAPDDSEILSERRVMVVSGDEQNRQIEFIFDLTAVADEVHFGDTKEGSFGVRVADSMAVDSKKGGVILNEHNEKNDAAWGKRSRWVDYSGPVDGETMGITILEHPDSFGAPCRWHVRTYGLFAANPFGEHHFVGGEPKPGHTLKKGETLHLHYKVLLHEGNADPEQIRKVWDQFAK